MIYEATTDADYALAASILIFGCYVVHVFMALVTAVAHGWQWLIVIRGFD